MTDTQTAINFQAQITNAFTAVYTVSNRQFFLAGIFRVSNVTGGPVTINLCLVPQGASPGTTNALMWGFSIPANDFIEFGAGQIIFSGWSVQAQASANTSLNVSVSGIEDVFVP